MFKSYNNTGKILPSIFSSWQNFLSARCALRSRYQQEMIGCVVPTSRPKQQSRPASVENDQSSPKDVISVNHVKCRILPIQSVLCAVTMGPRKPSYIPRKRSMHSRVVRITTTRHPLQYVKMSFRKKNLTLHLLLLILLMQLLLHLRLWIHGGSGRGLRLKHDQLNYN